MIGLANKETHFDDNDAKTATLHALQKSYRRARILESTGYYHPFGKILCPASTRGYDFFL